MEENKKAGIASEGEGTEMHRVHLGDGFYIDGHLAGDTLMPYDVIENGQSQVEMTGHPVEMKPMSMNNLRDRGFTPHVEKVHVKPHYVNNGKKSYYVKEHDRNAKK